MQLSETAVLLKMFVGPAVDTSCGLCQPSNRNTDLDAQNRWIQALTFVTFAEAGAHGDRTAGRFICSPWWLEDEEDEARVKGREKGKPGREGKGGMSQQRSRERRGIEAGGKYEWMPR